MDGNPPNRCGLKSGQLSLKLVKRQESLITQSNGHEEIVEQLRASAEESPEPEKWIDGHFQCVIKKLVHSFIAAENQKKKKKIFNLNLNFKILLNFETKKRESDAFQIASLRNPKKSSHFRMSSKAR